MSHRMPCSISDGRQYDDGFDGEEDEDEAYDRDFEEREARSEEPTSSSEIER